MKSCVDFLLTHVLSMLGIGLLTVGMLLLDRIFGLS
jgi:hypothetical protein